MFIKELSFRGKPARIICYPNQGMRIQCDELDISFRELQMLRLKTQGYTIEEIASELNLAYGNARNRLLDLRKRNRWVGVQDSNHIGITNKVRELELFEPMAHKGLLALMNEGNAYHRSRKKVLKK